MPKCSAKSVGMIPATVCFVFDQFLVSWDITVLSTSCCPPTLELSSYTCTLLLILHSETTSHVLWEILEHI